MPPTRPQPHTYRKVRISMPLVFRRSDPDLFPGHHHGNRTSGGWSMLGWLKGGLLVCGLTAMIVTSEPAPSDSQAQTLPPVPPRLSVPKAQYYATHPAELQEIMKPRPVSRPVLLP